MKENFILEENEKIEKDMNNKRKRIKEDEKEMVYKKKVTFI
jgi:hypothetical protein